MLSIDELRDWATLIERDGCPDEAKLVRDAANEIERLRTANDELTRRNEQLLEMLGGLSQRINAMRDALRAWRDCRVCALPESALAEKIALAARLTQAALED